MSIYQLMPEMSADEFDGLKASIAETGVQLPVEFDDIGNILDGHYRVRACEELGLDYPRFVRSGMGEIEKRAHVRRLNLTRRHLHASLQHEG